MYADALMHSKSNNEYDRDIEMTLLKKKKTKGNYKKYTESNCFRSYFCNFIYREMLLLILTSVVASKISPAKENSIYKSTKSRVLKLLFSKDFSRFPVLYNVSFCEIISCGLRSFLRLSFRILRELGNIEFFFKPSFVFKISRVYCAYR